MNLGHIKGLAQIVLNDQLIIRGLRIMDGLNGLFVSYPIDPFYKGDDLRSIVNPITRQLREHIENCILEKYQAAVEEYPTAASSLSGGGVVSGIARINIINKLSTRSQS